MPEEKKLTGYPSIDKPWLKYYSEEAILAPIPEMSIYEWIKKHNIGNDESKALNYLGYHVTYGELFRQIEETAAAFLALGVKEKDIVTIALPNIPENILCIYALNRIGAIANLVDLRCKGDDLARYYNEVHSEVAVVCDLFLKNTTTIVKQTTLKHLIVASPYDHLPGLIRFVLKRKTRIPKTEDISIVCWNDFIGKTNAVILPQESPKAHDTACIMHTSGTTGESKGVMLSNHSINAMAYQCTHDGFEYRDGDKCLNQVPPFLAYNILLSLHTPLSLKMEIELLPDYRPDIFAKNIMKYKPNHVMAGPADWSNFLNARNISDLSYLRALLSGSDTIRADTKLEINKILAEHGCQSRVMEGYGMTEVGSAACTNLPQCDVEGSVGIPLPKMTICIWDNENNAELPYNTKGEICITGPTLMTGYYNKPEETKAVLKKHKDGHLWMHSGDLGYMNENGCLFLDGRLKRIIIQHNGMKINPYEIERVLLKDESVKECCVVGTPDAEHGSGSIPVAFLELESCDSSTMTEAVEERLRTLCENELTDRYRPVTYHQVDHLPLTPNGKVDYRALEKQAAEMQRS